MVAYVDQEPLAEVVVVVQMKYILMMEETLGNQLRRVVEGQEDGDITQIGMMNLGRIVLQEV